MVEFVPTSVGERSQAWDERHIDLEAAARVVKGAPTGGFTSNVSGHATTFLTEWERHLTTIADQAEGHADALREVIRTYLSTESMESVNYARLGSYLTELR